MQNKDYIDGMLRVKICLSAEAYLKKNIERFNNQEMTKFRFMLNQFLDGKTENFDDDVYDFLVYAGILRNEQTREEEFASYLNKKYSGIVFRKILDVGAGRMCKLSVVLSKLGGELFAIDPNIRLLREEAKKLGINGFSKNKFVCDEFSKNGIGTNISRFTNIVGLEPCDATEHIIRQALKYDKAFDILLCGAPHNSLDGKTFEKYEDWYEYLKSISSEVSIQRIQGGYVASNNPAPDLEIQMEQ